MLGALTNRTPVTGDALPRAARLHAAAGHERHSFGELSRPWLNAPFAINILLFTTQIKQFIPFSPPCNCSYELKITFCVRGVSTAPCGVPTFVSAHSPSSDTPAFNHFWISPSIRPSVTRCSMNFIVHSWLIRNGVGILIHRLFEAQ